MLTSTASPTVAAIDLGGTKIRVGILELDGRLLAAESYPTDAQRGPQAIIEAMASHVKTMLHQTGTAGRLAAVGLGAPGPLNARTGVISFMPNLPGWEDYPVGQVLGEALGKPVAVGNDASVAAVAEHRFGAGRGTTEMVYISLGTGIGGGIISNGRLYNGATGAAGEIGHMVLDPLGPLCSCGNRGCLEALASGGGMERQAVARLTGGAESSLRAIADAGREITMHDIDEAARAGDAVARELIEDASVSLGWGIVSLLHLLNPQMIVFGGGLLALRDLLIEPAIALARDHSFRQPRDDVRFESAALEENAGVLGAGAIALELIDRQGRAGPL